MQFDRDPVLHRDRRGISPFEDVGGEEPLHIADVRIPGSQVEEGASAHRARQRRDDRDAGAPAGLNEDVDSRVDGDVRAYPQHVDPAREDGLHHLASGSRRLCVPLDELHPELDGGVTGQAGRCLGVGLRRIPDQTNSAERWIDGPQQFEQLPHGRQASQPSHIRWVVEVVLTADVDPGAIGVGTDTEDVHGRRRPRPVRVRDGLEGGGRGRDDHVEALARDLCRDGVGNGHVALRVVARHVQALPIHEPSGGERLEDPVDPVVQGREGGVLYQRYPPHHLGVADVRRVAVCSGVEVREEEDRGRGRNGDQPERQPTQYARRFHHREPSTG